MTQLFADKGTDLDFKSFLIAIAQNIFYYKNLFCFYSEYMWVLIGCIQHLLNISLEGKVYCNS